MMSAETGTCISLSETGGRIWELMEHSRSVDSLCKELGEEYQAELGVVDHDVLVFLENLQAEGAIVATDPPNDRRANIRCRRTSAVRIPRDVPGR